MLMHMCREGSDGTLCAVLTVRDDKYTGRNEATQIQLSNEISTSVSEYVTRHKYYSRSIFAISTHQHFIYHNCIFYYNSRHRQ